MTAIRTTAEHADAIENVKPRAKYERALEQMTALCDSLSPGDRLPGLPELMRRLEASERHVLRAADELRATGRIIRRQGAGTFVAEPNEETDSHTLVPSGIVDSPTVVAVRTPDSSYFDRCMDALFHQADRAGLGLVCKIISPGADLNSYVRPDADDTLRFVIFRYDLLPLALRIQNSGLRAVIVGAPPVHVLPVVPSVYGDHESGGYSVTRHLLDLGHRRLAYHAASADYENKLRWIGHRKALREAEGSGIGVEETILWTAEADMWETNPDLARDYFGRPDSPTAIIAWNDHNAARWLVGLQRAGIRSPEDVSVAGYDNLPESKLVFPQLTTVDHAIDIQLDTALELLTRPIRPSPTHATVVIPTLLPRGSTAPPQK